MTLKVHFLKSLTFVVVLSVVQNFFFGNACLVLATQYNQDTSSCLIPWVALLGDSSSDLVLSSNSANHWNEVKQEINVSANCKDNLILILFV